MAFVKLDTQILNSTVWQDADACRAFITALLMAEPFEVLEPLGTVNTFNTEDNPFVVPPGWYGLVRAAGPGIVHRALLSQESGMAALERLASPDLGSRTTKFEGRRMVRIDGGYLILNYIAHRDKDHSSAERQSRFRQREKERKTLPREDKKVAYGQNWDAIVAFYGGKCAYCQKEPWVDIDHIVATSRGGKHELSNIVPACKSCNSSKRAETWEPSSRHPFMSRVIVTPVTHADADADEKKEQDQKLGSETPKNGFRLPHDWAPSEDLKSWAIDQLLAAGQNHGVTLTGEIETFKDHWKAATGRGATKLDWDATFRNWIRNSLKFRSGGVNERTERHSAIDRVAGNVRRSNQSAPAGFESGGRVIDHG